MLVGHCELTGQQLIAWCNAQALMAEPTQRHLWNSYQFDQTLGNFSSGVFGLWLFLKHKLKTHNIASKYDQTNSLKISILFLDAQLDAMLAIGSPFNGFLVHSLEPYGHMTTLLKHNDTWYWLDSEKPERAILTGHIGDANLLTLSAVAICITALIPASTIDDTFAHPFRPRDGYTLYMRQPLSNIAPQIPPSVATKRSAPSPSLGHVCQKQQRPNCKALPTPTHITIFNELTPDTTHTTSSPSPYMAPPLYNDLKCFTHSPSLKVPHPKRLHSEVPLRTRPVTPIPQPETRSSDTPHYQHAPLTNPCLAPHTAPSYLCTPRTSMPSDITIIQWNPQGVKRQSFLYDLDTLISEQRPHIICICETHLFPWQHKHLKQMKNLLQDYTMFLSSSHTPPLLAAHTSFGRAPGGVLLAIHKSLSTHPAVTSFPTPADLHGYCVHVGLPMPNNVTCHVISMYMPPGNDTLQNACLQFIKETVAQSPSGDKFLIGGDFNIHLQTYPILSTAKAQAILTTTHLIPINASTSHIFTHIPHNTLHAPSMLDDIWVTQSIFDSACAQSGFSFSSPTKPPDSDHVPICITFPEGTIPILHDLTPPFSNPNHISMPSSLVLRHPIPKTKLEITKQTIMAELGTTCDALHSKMSEISNRVTEHLGRTPHIISPDDLKTAIHQLHIDTTSLAEEHTFIQQAALKYMQQICPTKVMHDVNKTHKPFLPRKGQRSIANAIYARTVITCAKFSVQRCLHHDDSFATKFNDISAHLMHTLATHPRLHKNGEGMHRYGPEPLSLLPPLPTSNERALWFIWLKDCHNSLRSVRINIRQILKKYGRRHTHQQCISRDFKKSPKQAHRQIFDDVNPSDNQLDITNHMTAIWDEEQNKFHTSRESMATHAHKYFSNQWSVPIPHTDSSNSSYPWCKGPSPLDPFVLASSATDATTRPSSFLTYVLRQDLFHRSMSKLARGKAAGMDGVPNELLMIMPQSYKASLRLLFILLWLSGTTPDTWKTSTTILLHKKGPHTHLKSKRPIGLGNSLSKLWTRFISTIFMQFCTDYSVLSPSQEGFRPGHNTSRQLQRLVHILTDARNSKQNIYLLYIDFSNAFNTIDHHRLFGIMHDLGFPNDAIDIVKDLFTNAIPTPI